MLISWRMLAISKGVRKTMFLTSFIQLLLFSLSIVSALSISQTIVGLSGGHFRPYWFIPLSLSIIIIGLLRPVLMQVQTKCSGQIQIKLREQYVRKLFSLGVLYQESNRTGDLTTTGVMRIEAIGKYFSVYLPTLLSAILVAATMILWITSVNKSVALICLTGFLGVLFVPAIWYAKIYSKGNEVWKEMASYRSDFVDNIQGMACLRNLEAQEKRREEMRKQGLVMLKKTMANLSVNSVESLFIYLFCGLGASVSVAYAAHITSRGILEPNKLVLLLFMITATFAPIYSLVNAWHIGFVGLSALTRLTEVLEQPAYPSMSAGQGSPAQQFECKNLFFTYPDSNEEVITDLSLTAHKGQSIAFVGRSGEGKTTLISIIAGLYPLQEGEISYKNLLLSEENRTMWLSKIGAIWQDQYLFSGTIRDNLLMAKNDASEEELLLAIDKAQLTDFVLQQENGLDSQIGERGALLSGGEKQRLALARLFLKDPEILIFDEATSSLDEQNQSYIVEAIKSFNQEKLVFIVAHRASTFKHADCIYYIEGGRIVDFGTHDELLNRCVGYGEIVKEEN